MVSLQVVRLLSFKLLLKSYLPIWYSVGMRLDLLILLRSVMLCTEIDSIITIVAIEKVGCIEKVKRYLGSNCHGFAI